MLTDCLPMKRCLILVTEHRTEGVRIPCPSVGQNRLVEFSPFVRFLNSCWRFGGLILRPKTGPGSQDQSKEPGYEELHGWSAEWEVAAG